MTNYAASMNYNGWHGPEVMQSGERYVVYIDIVFLVNLSMDLLLLLFLKRIMGLSSTPLRMAAAAAAGAVWACASLQEPVGPFLSGIPGLLASGAAMVWIAFERGQAGTAGLRLRRLCAETAGLLFAAAVMGGGFLALEELAVSQMAGQQTGAARQSLTFAAWALLAAGTAALCRGLWKAVQERRGKTKMLRRVRLVLNGRETETNALIDTGNRLRSPFGGKPVHVLEYEVCRELCGRVDQVIYIPYRSVGKQDGVIPGITFDLMEIGDGEEKILVEHPLIGIVKTPLSADGSYRMLLNETIGR